jgi:hypothetical protein
MHRRRLSVRELSLRTGMLAVGLPTLLAACSSSPCSYGNGAPMFQVIQPDGPTSAIPLCDENGVPPNLSTTAISQCGMICAQDFNGSGCCFSQWEPDTIECAGCP